MLFRILELSSSSILLPMLNIFYIGFELAVDCGDNHGLESSEIVCITEIFKS